MDLIKSISLKDDGLLIEYYIPHPEENQVDTQIPPPAVAINQTIALTMKTSLLSFFFLGMSSGNVLKVIRIPS